MILSEDRSALTQQEAYELVRSYVKHFWREYSNSISGVEEEDAVQDIALKIFKKQPNKDYDPNWKPGDVAHLKRASGAPYKDVDTSYMLDPDYNPDSPYDSLYYLMHMPEVSFIDKYNGRTTSKKYYIMNIVKNSLIDMTRKKDPTKYAVSLDQPIGSDDGDSKTTVGDMLGDDDESLEVKVEQSELRDILQNIMKALPATPLSDRIVGWNPVTGELGSSGEHIETPLSSRDIGLLLMNGYTKDEVHDMYHDTRTGEPVSRSTINKKWNDALTVIRDACRNSTTLRSMGVFNGMMDKA